MYWPRARSTEPKLLSDFDPGRALLRLLMEGRSRTGIEEPKKVLLTEGKSLQVEES